MSVSGDKSLFLSLQNVYETFAICVPTVLEGFRGPVPKSASDRRLERWCRNIIENAKIELSVIGREHVRGGRACLIMSNHQSLYDIPVLFEAFGSNLRMITKRELFSVPVFGRALHNSGFIAIDRGDRNAASESLDRAGALLANGTLVWIAPEGTRSRTGELLPFKKGGFQLAFQKGLPIMPVTLSGTRNVLPAKGARSTFGVPVRVTIHPEIDPEQYPRDRTGREKLMRDVRQVMESAL